MYLYKFYFVFFIFFIGCSKPWNNPYSTEKESYSIHYSSFAERPKHLDPVSSYSENEARFISQIYEPLVQYHYLDRPYRLEALTATKLLEPMLVHDESINYSIYKVRIKPGKIGRAHV